MMWPERLRLMRSMMQASVVDRPELGVGPVTSTRPSCRPAVCRTASGMCVEVLGIGQAGRTGLRRG